MSVRYVRYNIQTGLQYTPFTPQKTRGTLYFLKKCINTSDKAVKHTILYRKLKKQV